MLLAAWKTIIKTVEWHGCCYGTGAFRMSRPPNNGGACGLVHERPTLTTAAVVQYAAPMSPLGNVRACNAGRPLKERFVCMTRRPSVSRDTLLACWPFLYDTPGRPPSHTQAYYYFPESGVNSPAAAFIQEPMPWQLAT